MNAAPAGGRSAAVPSRSFAEQASETVPSPLPRRDFVPPLQAGRVALHVSLTSLPAKSNSWNLRSAICHLPFVIRQTLSLTKAHIVPAWISILLFAGWNSPAQTPSNDLFANRIILTGASITVIGSTDMASSESGEPSHAGNPGGNSIWWSWTAPANGDLIIDTDGSSFDTLLGIYTGSTVSSLSLVASNDDHGASVINGSFTNGLFSTSRARLQAMAGIEYQIAVDGFNDGTAAASGSVNLRLNFNSEPIVRPANDNFVARLSLNGDPVTTSLPNVAATREGVEPFHASRMGDTSVWWSWTAPVSAKVRITTQGTHFDTLLAVYTGNTLSTLALIASNDDEDPINAVLTSTLVFDATAGVNYQIAVDGFDGAAGNISLSIGSVQMRLSQPTPLADGTFQFVVNGVPGTVNEIIASLDLLEWTPIGTVTNTSGIFTYLDTAANQFPNRFYRALLK